MSPRIYFHASTSVIAVMAFVLAGTSCSKKRDKDLLPAGPPMADSVRFEYAVYLLPASSNDAFTQLKDVLARKYGEFKVVDEIPKQPAEMVVQARMEKDVRHQYAPPDMKSLEYFGRGITHEQALALQESEAALVLTFAHPKRNVWTALRLANSFVEEIAQKTGGLVWDEETREVFSPAAWHAKRLEPWTGELPDVASQTVIHAYNDGDHQRAITLGMAKMGLPDIVVEDFPWSANSQVGNLINLISQAIAEGKPFTQSGRFRLDLASIQNAKVREVQMRSLKPSGTGTACLTLRQAKWEEGDPRNRLVSVGSDAYDGNDIQAKQDQMLSLMFGSEDSIMRVRHNQELLAESEKEKAKLPELQKAFNAGLQPGEFIEVKAPFQTPDGGTEWMWVEVSSWKDGNIKGLLENDPFNVPNLHAGQVVEVRQEKTFDYIRQYPDKRVEGNTTAPILQKLNEGTREKAVSSAPVKCDADWVVPHDDLKLRQTPD